jgi:hypothetical protein
MKRVIALVLFFSLFLLLTVEVFAFYSDLERFWREMEILRERWRRQAELEYIEKMEQLRQQEKALIRQKEHLEQLINSCSLLNEEYSTGIPAEVIRGRYITAFEMCRQQEKNVDACIQKIQEIKEKWKARCQDVSGRVLIDHYYASFMLNVAKMLNDLKRTANKLSVGPYSAAALAGANQALAQKYPGSTFSYITGTGKIVVDEGEVYFQGWKFVQLNKREEGGLIVQVFPQKINFVNGRYNIAFYFDPNTKHWEVVEVNLPFDAQTERLLMSLGQGVRVLDKEIIYMLDEFLRNTTFGLDLYVSSKALLLQNAARRLVAESLFEYFTYDNYIAKVRAEEKRRSKPAEPQQTERKTGTTGPKQKKK